MTMLGAAAATCFEHRGDTIFLAAGTHDRQNVTPVEPPDSQAWLVLQTTAHRCPYDMKTLQAILKTIAVCRSSDRPPQPTASNLSEHELRIVQMTVDIE